MSLVTPSIGLIIWQLLIFISLFFFLKKYAWQHIINIIENREKKIASSLEMVKDVEKKIIDLKVYKDKIIEEAKIEKDIILKKANYEKNEIEKETKKSIDIERENMIRQIKIDIYNEKMYAIKYLRKYISDISISISEKILKKELSNKEKHQKFINRLLDELKY